ncbi:unnamed protein product [Candidula unifasciata]|uniref:Protein O-mannosyl-transferase 2 n=1 Tax=Candidula unifasciata TaxID=100452 RepID=A0A8S3YU53_9EUPU|nr:unnamed protein product [Candidula unifasciata]
MSVNSLGKQICDGDCGSGEGIGTIEHLSDENHGPKKNVKLLKNPTYGFAFKSSGGEVLQSFGKSVSDTVVLAKGSTHPKAMSTSRLGNKQHHDGCPSPDKSTLSTSSETSFEDDDSFSEVTDINESEIHEEKCMTSRRLKEVNTDEELHGDLRNRKFYQRTSKVRHNESELESRSDKSLAELTESSSDITPVDEQQIQSESRAYYLCWLVLTSLSFLTRVYNIEQPPHICWDETHFGKMGSWYINQTFFFDVHPPLGKMLVGLAGFLSGYDGSFPFNKPGDAYGDVRYVGMRVFCAVLGALLVPLAYQTVWLLTHSILASIFAASLILFDTGILALSRHILLDPIMMFFIMTSTYSCLKFLTYRSQPFSVFWWLWMAITGVCLSGAIGVKFVGLFVILFVGYTTAMDLWRLLGDLSLPVMVLCKHILARAICLIALPALIYMIIFAVHFRVLNRSGNGDGFFSSGFQSQLIGNKLYNVSMPQYVAFGSVITLKQRRTGGAYLHSHAHLYPEEYPPKQQQVTTYSHKDENNKWKIKPADRELAPSEDLLYLHSGDLVRLEHIATRRNLHSHKEPAPISRHHFQVSGYGQNGTGDANDIWMVEVEGASRGDKVQTVRSKIKFIHYHARCLLHSHDRKLPKWGWEQLEVTCKPNLHDTTSAWSVEEVIDPRLPNVSFEVYSPSFMEKFLESHAVMTQGNSGLKPKEGEITSHPWQWPVDYKGQIFSGQDHRIYMLGNPIFFWTLLVLKVVFLILWLSFSVGRKRNMPINKNLRIYYERTFKVCWWLLLGWLLHYLPFWGMTRVLYFHHYFPAFLYSAMFGGVMLDFLITLLCVTVPESWAMTMFHGFLFVTSGSILYSFYLFYPLVYGMSGPMANDEGSMMHRLKWMESWDI